MNLLSTKRFWKLFGKSKRTTAKKRTRRKKHRRRRRRKIRRRTRRKRYRRHRRGGNGDDDDDSDDEEHSHHDDDICYACEDGLEHGHTYGDDCEFAARGITKAQAEELNRERAEEDKNPQDSS